MCSDFNSSAHNVLCDKLKDLSGERVGGILLQEHVGAIRVGPNNKRTNGFTTTISDLHVQGRSCSS